MQYRKFGKLDWNVSVLGFGCMRLPVLGGDFANINEPEAIKMIRYAIDQGVNYVDTAYPYHRGNSEIVTGKALQNGYREKVKLATKLPIWMVKEADDFDKCLNEQLGKLQTDYIDFYLFHGIDKQKWENVIQKFDLLAKAEAAKKDGRIKYIGFSFHDKFDSFKQIIDGYDKWDFCQIQFNYMGIEFQAGEKGLKYAASKGIPVVVMEPLLGGKLANMPEPILDILRSNGIERSPVDLALQWLWNKPEVTVVLSGMSSMEQVKENLASAGKAEINSISDAELKTVDLVREAYLQRILISCTKCGYCMPCPNGVDIPGCFDLYNNGYMYNNAAISRNIYTMWFPEPKRASACIQCKECEKKCPQSIAISEWMLKVQDVLGNGKEY